MGLSIGANTTLFSIVDTILLKPLPYPDSGQLVKLMEANPGKQRQDSLVAPIRIED